jgi:ADP-ribose pyrophosphatase
MDKHLKETRIDGELVYHGHFLKIQRDTIALPDGKRPSANSSCIRARW